MSDHLPYKVEDLYAAGTRPLIAPIETPIPTDIDDLQAWVSPYGLAAGWEDLGALTGPIQTGRNLTKQGFGIEQATGDVLEQVQEVARTYTAPLGEVRPEILQLIEAGGETSTVAGSGTTAVPFGSITDLPRFRIAFIGRFKQSQGVVIEPGGRKRGRYIAYVGYQAELDADNVQSSWGKGALASLQLQMKLYPDPTITAEGEEHGTWLIEDARTIAP